MVAIVGASGSGKSDADEYPWLPDKPTSGTYRVAGSDIAQLDGDALARLRCGTLWLLSFTLPSAVPSGPVVEVPAYAVR